PSENFVSNEKTYQYVIPTLQRTLTPGGVYLGVGPEQNFTYLVNLKPRMAVIVDIRRQNAMTHLMYKALFELAPTRADFLSRLFSRPISPSSPRATDAAASELFAALSAAPPSNSAFATNWKAIVDRLVVSHHFALSDDDLESMQHVFRAFFEAGPDISYAYHIGSPPSPTQWLVTFAQIQTLTNAEGANMAFLATEENYRWLRALERRNMVIPVVGDFGGPNAIRAVGAYLRAHGAVVTAFYVSNVEQYLFNGFGADQRFYSSVATLPLDSTSTFIRSLPGGNPVIVPFAQLSSTPGLTSVRLSVQDSSGMRIITTTGVDSGGTVVTSRIVAAQPTPTVASTSAFVSGIAGIRGTLDAFTNGRLTTYRQVSDMTKTDGWSDPRR
ncbi:MAG TPA: hypothetical protein VHV78_18470, partial [Gemmatimonadaceae bacterium]|nr:hypothetical protein [Gemmatimonadaceae bacterium]